jgi:hypothetical protein
MYAREKADFQDAAYAAAYKKGIPQGGSGTPKFLF